MTSGLEGTEKCLDPIVQDDHLTKRRLSTQHQHNSSDGALKLSHGEQQPSFAVQILESQAKSAVLYESLVLQIWRGCEDSRCHTHSCATSRRRNSTGPYRAFTKTSARAIAAVVILEAHASRELCQFLPSTPTTRVEVDPTKVDLSPSSCRVTQSNYESRGKEALGHGSLEDSSQEAEFDHKSLIQNLFGAKLISTFTITNLRAAISNLRETRSCEKKNVANRVGEKQRQLTESSNLAGSSGSVDGVNKHNKNCDDELSWDKCTKNLVEEPMIRDKHTMPLSRLPLCMEVGLTRQTVSPSVLLRLILQNTATLRPRDTIVRKHPISLIQHVGTPSRLTWRYITELLSVRSMYIDAPPLDSAYEDFVNNLNYQNSSFLSMSIFREDAGKSSKVAAAESSFVDLAAMFQNDQLALSFLHISKHESGDIFLKPESFNGAWGTTNHLSQEGFPMRDVLCMLWRNAGRTFKDMSIPCGIDGDQFDIQLFKCSNIMRITLGCIVDRFFHVATPDVWKVARKHRQNGHIAVVPYKSRHGVELLSHQIAGILEIMDLLDDDLTRGIMRQWTRMLSTNLSHPSEERKNFGKRLMAATIHSMVDASAFALKIASDKSKSKSASIIEEAPRSEKGKGRVKTTHVLEIVVELLRTILLEDGCDGFEVYPGTSMHGALEVLSLIVSNYTPHILDVAHFHTPFIENKRLGKKDTGVELIGLELRPQGSHLLQFPWVFSPAYLVTCFRSTNFRRMCAAVEQASLVSKMLQRIAQETASSPYNQSRLRRNLSPYRTSHLYIHIRRDQILEDALDGLWRRREKELKLPLKVSLGESLGEEGEDLGGVQQEFFRLALIEALAPKYGVFKTDPVNQMSWFQPGSLEPMYKYEMIGLLTGLAVYNGNTLPFTFPIAFYMKLLGLEPCCLADIADGWPALASGLQALQDWSDGDVEDVFCRTYEFSIDVFGCTINTDLSMAHKKTPDVANSLSEAGDTTICPASPRGLDSKHTEVSATTNPHRGFLPRGRVGRDLHATALAGGNPVDPEREVPMVTNKNRKQYIEDYIYHLTGVSICDQFNAFAKGFHSIVPRHTLIAFTPESLRRLIEGVSRIKVAELEEITGYEGGYHRHHPTIESFWTIMHDWGRDTASRPAVYDEDQEQGSAVPVSGQEHLRRLITFVTASERLPAGGASHLVFIVQKNGVGDARLPTSLTCFGRLLLPEYTSESVMRQMLERALESGCLGFGLP